MGDHVQVKTCIVYRHSSAIQKLAVHLIKQLLLVDYNAQCNQPSRSTQPGHPFVGRHNEYQPKGGDALWLGSEGKNGLCVGGR